MGYQPGNGKPWYHDQAILYMEANIGTPYADACAITRGEMPADPHAEPPFFKEMMAHMFQHPGMLFEEARQFILESKRR
jgi:hypothetical protein